MIRRDSMQTSRARSPHPDDLLRRLAKGSRPPIVPSVYSGYKKPRDTYRATVYAVLAFFAMILLVALMPFAVPRNTITIRNVVRGQAFMPASLASTPVEIRIDPASAAANAVVLLDGAPAVVTRTGGVITWQPPSLTEGSHVLRVTSGGRLLWRGGARKDVSFRVDATPPELQVDVPAKPTAVDAPYRLSGTTELGAIVSVLGQRSRATDGQFAVTLSSPPIGKVEVTAVDEAGNATVRSVRASVALPALRAVHMSAISWMTPSLKDPVMAMAAKGQINAVQLDLKDEAGDVGYRSSVRQVNDIGAGKGYYDLREAVQELHAKKLRVVGRIVVFRDPLLTQAAWNAGNKDEVIQGTDGEPYKSRYGGFANPASKAVQDYNLDILREAAEAGVDDILFDYIRRPEGDLSTMRYAGLDGPDVSSQIDAAIVEFLRRAAERLRGTPTRLGVSVFGIAAKSPDEVAQNVPAMASVVDYIAPMVYPSHWTKGQYNVSDPSGQPYEIVNRSLKEFQRLVTAADVDAIVVPWLQDFSLGRTYGAKEVRAQIDAARELNLMGFLLWDPKVTYSSAGVPADAPELEIGPAVTVPATPPVVDPSLEPIAGATASSAVPTTVATTVATIPGAVPAAAPTMPAG